MALKPDAIEKTDKNCPSLNKPESGWDFEMCSFGCHYVVLIKADRDRHTKLCHYEENRARVRKEQQRKRRQNMQNQQAQGAKK